MYIREEKRWFFMKFVSVFWGRFKDVSIRCVSLVVF